jgi:uncharacterized protein (TIGR02453 family)
MYFSKDFLDFFITLAANNHKEWFDQNRKRYTSQVKEPFQRFTSAVIEAAAHDMPGIEKDPKKAIFRINRDVRFSQDKTPYKLHSSAYLSPYGKKDPSFSGFYYQFGPEHLMLAGGLYSPESHQLLKVRRHIMARPDEFYALIQDKAFVKLNGGIQGAENKRITDKEVMAATGEHPILLKKQMYFAAYLPPETIERPEILDIVIQHLKVGLPLAQFFESALSNVEE